MNLRDTIRDIIVAGTTVNFGPGPIGLLEESKINRLTTELTDAVLDYVCAPHGEVGDVDAMREGTR